MGIRGMLPGSYRAIKASTSARAFKAFKAFKAFNYNYGVRDSGEFQDGDYFISFRHYFPPSSSRQSVS